MTKKKYFYTYDEYSQDTRSYEIESDVKLTKSEVQELALGCTMEEGSTNSDKNNKIITDIKKGCEIFADEYLSQQFNGGVVSITCIDEHNTAQFHEQAHRNKLTTKQIRNFNQQASEQKG